MDMSAGYAPVGDTVFYRPATAEDLPRLIEIEAASYPADEAASPEGLKFRLENAGDVFLVAEQSGAIVGYVCGTRSDSDRLSHESMAKHDKDGALLCIHSVVVEESHRRKGVGTRLLKSYVNYVKGANLGIKAMALICKAYLESFYQDCGFSLVGPSPVVHGADPWTEMRLQCD